MAPLILPLHEAPDDPALIGGKAAGLARLLHAGVAVPDGFVLITAAFDLFVDANDLRRHLSSPLAAGRALALLRDAPWPDTLQAAVTHACHELLRRAGGRPLAVRSSARAEDSAGASFAGQHVTVLNVTGEDALFDAILQCWASLFGEEARRYRETHRLAPGDDAMAVVVQTLVPAECAGVAFTVDPVSGDSDLILIDAAWGLGEGIVSGAVTPDHYAVRKGGWTLARREVSEQHVRVVPRPDSGTAEEPLPDDLARRQVLSDDEVVDLARACGRLEDALASPLDIEWARAGDTFYFLQARPVTAVATPEPEEWVSEFDTDTSPDTIWTAANIQEVLPDRLSPFGCSIMLAMLEAYGTSPIERMGVKLKTRDPFNAYFYGRAFLNVTMSIEVMDQVPFGSMEALMEQFYGQARAAIEVRIPERRLTPARIWRYANVVPRMLWATLRMPADIRRAEETIAQLEDEARRHPTGSFSDSELVDAIDRTIPRTAEVSVIHVSGAGITSSAFETLRQLTERWLGDDTGTLQARLCTGLARVESAQPAYELWDLSRQVLSSSNLRAAFEPHNGAEIERRVASLQGEDADRFRELLASFLQRHGHRSVMEAEIAARSWEEDLPTVYAMVRNYLHAGESAAPRRVEERQRHDREAATAEAMARLRWWQKPVFKWALTQAQEWVRKREHTKSLMVRGVYLGRRLSRELARRLAARGLLNDPFDLYDLRWEEGRDLLRGAISKEEAYARISRRRDEARRNSQVVLPETFQGRPKPLRPQDIPLPEGRTLRGIPVSPGRVTGRARVILDPRRDAEIEPGEILVAPVTDAGWTPLFIAAGGVVVDIGGTLSHGSTVAREYGLPAVVNVKHGTRAIRTGQTITVDGTQGIVVIEDGAPTP